MRRDPMDRTPSRGTVKMLRNAGVLPALKKKTRPIGGELNSRGEMVKPRPQLGKTDARKRTPIPTKPPPSVETMLRNAGTIP